MKYLLDTNVCIRYLNGRAPHLREKLNRTPAKDIVVCSVVRAELFFGAFKSQTPEASLAKQQRFLRPYVNVTLPFDDLCLFPYAQIRTDLEKKGQIIGSNDMLIAAIAIAHNLTLITHNEREFSRIGRLLLEDWESQL